MTQQQGNCHVNYYFHWTEYYATTKVNRYEEYEQCRPLKGMLNHKMIQYDQPIMVVIVKYDSHMRDNVNKYAERVTCAQKLPED